jgi:predicted NBD/HSP70 family sugar kinase
MTGDQSLLKRINRMAIVRYVKSRPGLVRGDLAEITGLAGSTISVLVNELIAEGWLLSHGSPERKGAGRRPKRLTLDRARLGVLGAELGVDYIAAVACNLQGEILFSRMTNYRHRRVSRSVRDASQLVLEARDRLLAQGRRPLGVGVGLPGMVGTDDVLRFAPNIGWRDVAIGALMTDALRGCGCGELKVLNDADAGALGEYHFGAAQAASSVVFVSVGFGVGAGIVLDDRLHRGHEGLSGEVGHSILAPGGLPCPCGRRGCAETLLSQKAVSRRVTGREDPILPFGELFGRLARGDAAVARAAKEAGGHLGLVVHNLVIALNPAVVVLGGPLSRLEALVEASLATLHRLEGDSPYHHTEVRVSRFGPYAGSVGGAASVLHRLLHPLA